jgi:hypothetical protein
LQFQPQVLPPIIKPIDHPHKQLQHKAIIEGKSRAMSRNHRIQQAMLESVLFVSDR